MGFNLMIRNYVKIWNYIGRKRDMKMLKKFRRSPKSSKISALMS